jgi:hypothetical protein
LGGSKAKTRRKRARFSLSQLGFCALICIFVGVAAYLFLSHLRANMSHADTWKAAIVDHLSLTQPNQTFVQAATDILGKAGFEVDYYAGEEVTVDFYRTLPQHGYKLIVLRVHSSATEAEGQEGSVVLFSSERVSPSKYIDEQISDRLKGVAFSVEEKEAGILYFGIGPLFVEHSMIGDFKDTVILMMGCEGLDNPSMAQAFVMKGAKVYVSWNQPVMSSHTDRATTDLLRHFVIERLPLEESVLATFETVGFDPVYNSLIIYYPAEAGEYTLSEPASP